MEKKTEKNVALRKIQELHRRKREIMALEPGKALDHILEAENPIALVHAFSEQDFHLLVHDIGPEDALPLFSLASDKQWEYILDAEVWDRDRLDLASTTRWFELLHRANPDRMLNWLVARKLEFLEFYLFKNIEVRIREHDQDPSDFGKDWFSLDNHFYLRIISDPYLKMLGLGEIDKKRYRQFLETLVHNLAALDHLTYQKALLEAAHIIPAESEEEAYRLRNVRLAEKGFLPFEEAVGVYQPLTAKELSTTDHRRPHRQTGETRLSVTLYPVQMLEAENEFTRALAQISSDQFSEQTQAEFAGLCNRIVAADGRKVKSREDLQQVVRKACGYLSIGMQHLSGRPAGSASEKKNQPTALLQRHLLEDIFRVGYGRALKLNWRARQWLQQAWFSSRGLPLTFWGEAWLGVLGGLLVKKPLYFDNYRTGKLYREFESPEEIQEADAVLRQIIAVDDILSLSQLDPSSIASYRFLTFKNFLLTFWARDSLGLSSIPAAMNLDDFKLFFRQLWTSESTPGKIRQSSRESFLQWLSSRSGLREDQISENLGETLERLFLELEDEYGQVKTEDLDPRFIQHFLIVRSP